MYITYFFMTNVTHPIEMIAQFRDRNMGQNIRLCLTELLSNSAVRTSYTWVSKDPNIQRLV